MSTWLLSIVGITVVGVLLELLLTDSPLSRFVRCIFAFFILFIIVQPLPGFFRTIQNDLANGNMPVNSDLVNHINQQTREALLERTRAALEANGFDNCIVIFFNGKVFVNAYNSTKKDEAAIIQIVTATMGMPATAVEVFL